MAFLASMIDSKPLSTVYMIYHHGFGIRNVMYKHVVNGVYHLSATCLSKIKGVSYDKCQVCLVDFLNTQGIDRCCPRSAPTN